MNSMVFLGYSEALGSHSVKAVGQGVCMNSDTLIILCFFCILSHEHVNLIMYVSFNLGYLKELPFELE